MIIKTRFARNDHSDTFCEELSTTLLEMVLDSKDLTSKIGELMLYSLEDGSGGRSTDNALGRQVDGLPVA